MRPIPVRSLALAVVLCSFPPAASRAFAQAETAGVPVVPVHSAAEVWLAITPDHAGGAFVAFKSHASVNGEVPITTARLTATAEPDPSWDTTPVTGITVWNTAPPRVFVLAGPSVWVLGELGSPSNGNPFAIRKRDADGYVPPDITSLLTSEPDPFYSDFIAGPAGSVWLVRHGQEVNRLDPDGSLTLFSTPFSVSSFGTPDYGVGPTSAAVEDGASGGYFVRTARSIGGDGSVDTQNDLFAYRLGSDGTLPWSGATRTLTRASHDQFAPQVVGDPATGMIATWTDRRSLTNGDDIYAIRLQADGALAPGWTANGKPIASTTGPQFDSRIVGDGAGGAWILWVDARSGDNDLYFTHILPSGAIASGFPVNGRPISDAPGTQYRPSMVPDGSGGFFAVWIDLRDGEPDLYGTHIDGAGSVVAGWDANGTSICTDPSKQDTPVLAATAPGHAIIAWADDRQGTTYAYATAVSSNAPNLGVGGPRTPRLSLAPAANPARGGVELRVSSPDIGPIRVMLLDVSGRVRAEQVIGGPLHDQRVRFEAPGPGLYFLRAEQRGALASGRVAVLR